MNVRAMARALGRRGGQVRARRLSAAQTKRIASLGGTARAQSLQAARRIEENFAYLAAVDSLRKTTRAVTTRKAANTRLPGIYRPKD